MLEEGERHCSGVHWLRGGGFDGVDAQTQC
jgi:hypothetical protein